MSKKRFGCQVTLMAFVIFLAFIYQKDIRTASEKFSHENIPNILQNISLNGGKSFVLSDGRIIEYFESGEVDNPITITFIHFHGAFLSGKICSVYDEELKIINKKRLQQ